MTTDDLQATIAIARDIATGHVAAVDFGTTLRLAAAVVELSTRIAALPPVVDATASEQPSSTAATPDTPAATTATINEIQREPVRSSNIRSIGYDRGTGTLEVEFHNGAVWRYVDVSPDRHLGLLGADSIGAYFARYVKGKHAAKRLDQPGMSADVVAEAEVG